MDDLHAFLRRTLNCGLAGVIITKRDTGHSNILFEPLVLQNRDALIEVLDDLRKGIDTYKGVFIDLPNTPPS